MFSLKRSRFERLRKRDVKKEILQVILATVGGIAGGTLIGVLFAPDKGSESRRKIKEKGNGYLKRLKEDLVQVRKSLNETAEETQEKVESEVEKLKKMGEKATNEAKETLAYEEWNKEDLLEEAKKAKISGYTGMSKEELIEALKNS